MLLGYSLWGMPDVSIDVSLPHLAGVGYDAVEIVVLPRFSTALTKMDAAERQRIPGLLKSHRLTLSAVNYYTALLEPDPTIWAGHLAAIKETIDLAVDWAQGDEPPVVISGVGGSPGELPARMVEVIDRAGAIAEHATQRGVVVALEPHIGAAIETPDLMAEVLDQIDSPAIRVNFDISHFNVMGIPIEESVAKMLPYTAHTHVKDERGRTPDYEYVVPGEGEFDYVAYLQAMKRGGYAGVVSVEISFMVQRRAGYDPLATAAISYDVIAPAFEKAGVQRV
ncbi:MAG: sugar phosphate isomerase/epimerase [Caldilineaceae bacterium]|nr:sugar phosphate isomerase/epimerase [Caldilineaceae bacterium]